MMTYNMCELVDCVAYRDRAIVIDYKDAFIDVVNQTDTSTHTSTQTNRRTQIHTQLVRDISVCFIKFIVLVTQ